MSIGTHAYLVERAARWLRGTGGCAVVGTEKPVPELPVIPDAIGWTRSGYSIHIECKTSRADFMADRRKWLARMDASIGDERWYLAPKGVLLASDMPEGVGLLEVCGKVIRRTVPAVCRRKSLAERAEMIILCNLAWHAIGGHLGRPGDTTRVTRHDRPADLSEVA